MITRYERYFGAITLLTLGSAILLSRSIVASTQYWLAANYGFTQHGFSALALVCGFVLLFRTVSRSWYLVLIFPYTIYWVANGTYSYNAHLSAVVPGLLTCLLIALLKNTISELYKYAVLIMREHGRQHTAPNA